MPLDKEFLAELLDGDREFGQELLSSFEQATEQRLEEAAGACRSGDQETAVRAFHTLKGSAASVGLGDLRQASLVCEQMAKSGDLSGCAARLAELRQCVAAGRELLLAYLEELPR